jgi:hypothetical protein
VRWPSWHRERHGFRRWYVAAPILAVTLAAQWKVAHPAPVYRAAAVVALQPPTAETVKFDAPNPYSNPRSSLAATAAMVSQGLMSPSEQARLRAEGVVGTYNLQPRNSGTVQEPYFELPRIDVSVEAGDPATAKSSVVAVVADLDGVLLALQNQVGVEAGDRIVSLYLVMPSADRVFGSKIRGLFAVTLLGWGAAFLIPRWIKDAVVRRSRSRTSGSGGSARSATPATSATSGSGRSPRSGPGRAGQLSEDQAEERQVRGRVAPAQPPGLLDGPEQPLQA